MSGKRYGERYGERYPDSIPIPRADVVPFRVSRPRNRVPLEDARARAVSDWKAKHPNFKPLREQAASALLFEPQERLAQIVNGDACARL